MPENANSIAAFTSCDVEAVVQDEVRLAISRYQYQASLRAILLAGQPGAGKAAGFDSNVNTALPSEVLTGYWKAPWTPEEIQCVHDDIDHLREKERRSQLGQVSVIDELVRRVEAVQLEAPPAGMDMLQM